MLFLIQKLVANTAVIVIKATVSLRIPLLLLLKLLLLVVLVPVVTAVVLAAAGAPAVRYDESVSHAPVHSKFAGRFWMPSIHAHAGVLIHAAG